MKHAFTLLVACLLLVSATVAQVPTKAWDHTFGGSDEERLVSLLPTADAGYIVVGTSASPASGDKSQPSRGEEDIWVVKVNAAGGKQWDRTLGGSAFEGAGRVLSTSDGGYLIGGYSSSPASGDKTQPGQGMLDYWLIKLDAQGARQWDRTIGGAGNDILTSLQQTPDGGFLAGGNSNSPASGNKSQPSQGGNDFWLVKLDAQGVKQWDYTYGGSGGEALANLQVLPDGTSLLGGSSRSGISGDKSQLNQGDWDYWVVKIDAQGRKLWDRTWGGLGSDYLSDLQLSAAGTMLLAGRCTSGATGDKSYPQLGDWDYWVVKADEQGIKLWDQTVGTPREDLLNCLLPTSDGGCLLGGTLDASAALYAVVKLDGTGAQRWTHSWGGDGTAQLVQLQPTPDGGYLLGGMSTATAGGDKSQPSQGGPIYGDYWVVKLASTPLPVQGATAASSPLLAFPNPAGRTKVQLRYSPTASPVYLLSLQGRVLAQWPRGTTTIPVEQVAPGAYVVRVGQQNVRLLVL